MNQEEKILHELLTAPRFKEWVSDRSHDDYWSKWLNENPQNKEVMEDAIAILRGLPVKKAEVTGEEIEESFQKLEERATQDSGKSVRHFPRWLSYAAAVFILLIAFWMWNSNHSDRPEIELTITTAAGEQQDVLLPDSSLVVLNGNSSLQYNFDRSSGARAVILDGEAHFKVKTIGEGQDRKPFIVKTPDINVAVLGTVFSVSSDSIWTVVVLEEGKVQLSGLTNNDLLSNTLLMKPGEKVLFNSVERTYIVDEVDAIEYNSWTHNQLSLVNRSAEEVVRWMKRNYGIRIHLPDEFKNSSLTGSVDLEDPATAVQVIAFALGLEPVKSGEDQWYFEQIKTNE